MRLALTMFGLEDGSASLGLYGDLPADGSAGRPPHVQVTVTVTEDGTRAELRRAAIARGLDALEDAARALRAELE